VNGVIILPKKPFFFFLGGAGFGFGLGGGGGADFTGG